MVDCDDIIVVDSRLLCNLLFRDEHHPAGRTEVIWTSSTAIPPTSVSSLTS